jgi:hypothetical protein
MGNWAGILFCSVGALALIGWTANVLRRGSAYIPHRTKSEWHVFNRKHAPLNYWGFVTFLLLWSALMAAGAVALALGSDFS